MDSGADARPWLRALPVGSILPSHDCSKPEDVHDDGLLCGAGQDDDRLLIARRVFLSVGDKWRDIYVVAGSGLDAGLDVVVQEHKDRVTGHHIDRGLGLTVMVVLGARPWRHVGF